MKTILNLTAGVLAVAATCTAGIVTVVDSVGGQPVSAQAEYAFESDTLTITITNLLVNPTSVSQAISGIDFSLASGLTGTLISGTGELVRVGKDGVVTSQGNTTN